MTSAEKTALFDGPWGLEFPPLMTLEQAARFFQLTKDSLYHLRSEGRLEGTYCKVTGKLRFFRNKLLEKALNHDI